VQLSDVPVGKWPPISILLLFGATPLTTAISRITSRSAGLLHFDTREEKIACEKSGGCPDREAVEPDLTLAAAIEETAPIAGAVANLRPPPFQRVRSLI